jgi:hypothetical protein
MSDASDNARANSCRSRSSNDKPSFTKSCNISSLPMLGPPSSVKPQTQPIFCQLISRNWRVVAILILLSVPACHNGSKPPRYAKSVSVVPFGPVSSRPVNPEFQIFPSAADVKRPYRILALVCRHAKPQDQGLMLTAIAWRAQQLGADAMILLPPEATGYGFTDLGRFSSGGQGEPIYRAHAILYTDIPSAEKSKPTSNPQRP